MALLRAPSALRVPISRVRSVTLTSMMFMTPMPPTSSEIAAMTTIAIWMVLIMVIDWSMIESRLMAVI